MKFNNYLESVQTEMFVTSENNNFDQRHNNQLKRSRDSKKCPERDQDSGRCKVGVKQAVICSIKNYYLFVVV